MSTTNQGAVRADSTTGRTADRDYPTVHHSTETKASLKTTELIAFIAAVVAVVVTAAMVGESGDGTPDPFGAAEALRYVTFLTIGYMVARGLAKAGSREGYDAS